MAYRNVAAVCRISSSWRIVTPAEWPRWLAMARQYLCGGNVAAEKLA